MRLKQIKLAGFKSFVDPTTVALPTNLSGIVGPNGCGKSNIIDAVRWVMGESSAKYLRGESMADVIFNGSSARKPAGQAAIELHFDNSDGGLGGIYAQYAEIVVRRQVAHDGQSVYFLNGTVCRRRDITDIFLGTGLGPRSYAIIEQGTISRLIEAKPEELRVYLEEAAGISKYKERRRETELRLQHTRDNLSRLTDLRDELQKQLDHLSKQAATAEKYQTLKDQERTLRAQLLAIRAKNLQNQSTQEQHVILTLEKQLEEHNAAWQALATDRELQQQTHIEFADEVQTSQHSYYQCNTELARVEQTLQHHRERQLQLQQDAKQALQEIQHAQQQLQNENERCVALTAQIASLSPQAIESKAELEKVQQHYHELESAAHDAQSHWDQFTQSAHATTQQAQVEQTRIQHLEKHLLQIQDRLARLQQEQEKYTQMELPLDIQSLQDNIATVTQTIHEKQQSIEAVQQQLRSQRDIYQQQQQEIDALRTDLQSSRGRYASLQALQEAALGKNVETTVTWLKQHHLENNPRLAQQLQVEAGWELAVETVLSEYLEAICINDINALLPGLAINSQSAITLIDAQSNGEVVNATQFTTASLSTKVSAPTGIRAWLQHIYIADDLSQAIILQQQLSATDSVITKDGIWVGKNWLRMRGENQEKSGVLMREKELADIQQAISRQVSIVESSASNLVVSEEHIQQLEADREQLQKELSVITAQHADLNAQLKVKQAQLTQTQQQKAKLSQESQELITQQTQENTLLATARSAWQTLMQQAEQNAVQRESLQQQRNDQREQLQLARQQVQQIQQQTHQLTTQVEVLQTQLQASQQHQQHLIDQQQIVERKQVALNEQLTAAQQPETVLNEELTEWLSKQQAAEKILQEKRQNLSHVEEQLRSLEKQQQHIDQQRQQTRNELEQQRLQQQSHQVRLQALHEQLQEMQCELTVVLQDLPEEANESAWDEQLAKVVQRIERLGPINLAAISEHATLSERKNYLDQQNDDLVTALTTLEDAIHKIDKETRQRFKEVYEKVNGLFQELFPRIFGGGNAYLELTGEDLLQTGVNVIARPPGKRNSTIHLLSGGEKALTAIALVFAIFQLNPAPFCMLDEVDAPLDDANIGRFCELVKEMAKSVQFIFISHNKLAIEMAEQLLGVTMQEPGVSRLVAVDMNAAMEMAAA